jgi:hypothetical protein
MVTNTDGLHAQDTSETAFYGLYIDDIVIYGDSLEGTRGSSEESDQSMDSYFSPLSSDSAESVSDPPDKVEEVGDDYVETSEEDDIINSRGSVEFFDGKLFGISLLFITTIIMAVSVAKGYLKGKKGDI